MTGHILRADGSSLPARDGLTIGRQAGCDIVLDDHKASRRHAVLHVAGSVVEVEDLGSSNGTLLNGKPVTRRMLRDGDEVRIGATVLRYVERLAAAPGPAAPVAPVPATAPDDDLDLFGGDGAAPTPAPSAPAAAPKPLPAAPAPVPPPPVAAAPRPSVVEFEDEVVEVRRPAAPAAAPAAPALDARAPVLTSQRVLQFQKQAAGKGPLGDDMGQLAGGARWLLYLLVAVVGSGLAWLAMTAVS